MVRLSVIREESGAWPSGMAEEESTSMKRFEEEGQWV
jgi:hypothetical protein